MRARCLDKRIAGYATVSATLPSAKSQPIGSCICGCAKYKIDLPLSIDSMYSTLLFPNKPGKQIQFTRAYYAKLCNSLAIAITKKLKLFYSGLFMYPLRLVSCKAIYTKPHPRYYLEIAHKYYTSHRTK
ncbi:hypothetical protein BMETH_178_3 [methanotrophic bacterial endosymbiont of Bathymodiolus sp.]|nr:hypothetical protein BMETH_178_3 [methanotrophic bacterial endosymbiont of Bathymodiolus sp.]